MANYNLHEHETEDKPVPVTHVVELDKAANQTVRWLQKAAAPKSDNRPILKGIYVDGAIVAVDGFRFHAAPVPHMFGDELDGLILDFGKVPANAKLIKAEEVEGRWPDYYQIVPRDEPQFELWVNPSLLIDALQGMRNGESRVRIVVHKQNWKWGGENEIVEVHGKGADERPVYALVMGMQHVERYQDYSYYWRPTDKVESEE